MPVLTAGHFGGVLHVASHCMTVCCCCCCLLLLMLMLLSQLRARMMQQWNRGQVQFADQQEFEAKLQGHVDEQFRRVVDPEVSLHSCSSSRSRASSVPCFLNLDTAVGSTVWARSDTQCGRHNMPRQAHRLVVSFGCSPSPAFFGGLGWQYKVPACTLYANAATQPEAQYLAAVSGVLCRAGVRSSSKRRLRRWRSR